jgi:hypothetical protein
MKLLPASAAPIAAVAPAVFASSLRTAGREQTGSGVTGGLLGRDVDGDRREDTVAVLIRNDAPLGCHFVLPLTEYATLVTCEAMSGCFAHRMPMGSFGRVFTAVLLARQHLTSEPLSARA